jgi:hypothetical protein
MKQLSIRLLAPVSIASTLLFRKSLQLIAMPQIAKAKWRLYWNFCPECKSLAPKIHQCEVCQADTKSHFYWNKEVEKTWWKRYAQKHNIPA